MSKMRLTTLNLDDECLDILGTHKNKSKYARECILLYANATEQADHFEDVAIKWVAAMRDLACAMVDKYDYMTMTEFLAYYMSETPLAIHQMDEAGYLKDALVAAAVRHVKP